MSKAILVRGARQLLTLHGSSGPRRGAALNDLGVIDQGALLIVDGLVHSVGTSRRIENMAAARHAIEVSANGRVVIPGFVDSHTHLISQADKPGYEKLLKTARATPARTLEVQAKKILQGFVSHGTTTLEAKSGGGLDEIAEIRVLKLLTKLHKKPIDVMATYFGANLVPPEYEGKPDEYTAWMSSSMLPMIRRRGLATFVDARCEAGAFSLPETRAYLDAARNLGFLLQMHAGPTAHAGSIALAVELGATSVVQIQAVEKHEVDLLANSATVAALAPGLVFHRGSDQYPPARQLIDGGAAVALATNYHATTSPSYSMQMVLSLACTHMQMSPEEAISAGTINGAHALRSAARIGSLEAGKSADLAILNVSDYREIPLQFGVNLVSSTMKRGEIVFDRSGWKWPGNW